MLCVVQIVFRFCFSTICNAGTHSSSAGSCDNVTLSLPLIEYSYVFRQYTVKIYFMYDVRSTSARLQRAIYTKTRR